eukprot:scaffold134383_cov49-Prasinocladus_malaysianus.AAC.1
MTLAPSEMSSAGAGKFSLRRLLAETGGHSPPNTAAQKLRRAQSASDSDRESVKHYRDRVLSAPGTSGTRARKPRPVQSAGARAAFAQPIYFVRLNGTYFLFHNLRCTRGQLVCHVALSITGPATSPHFRLSLAWFCAINTYAACRKASGHNMQGLLNADEQDSPKQLLTA